MTILSVTPVGGERARVLLAWCWFDGAAKAAIIGGILVPAWSVEDVAAYVRTLSQ